MTGNSDFRFHDVAILSLDAGPAPLVVTSADVDRRLAPFYARTRSMSGLVTSLAGDFERRQWPAEVSFILLDSGR